MLKSQIKSLVKSDSRPTENTLVRANFYVQFQGDPNTLPRLIEPFAKLSLIPDRIFCDREAHAERVLNLEVRLHEVEVNLTKRLESILRAVIGVKTVIVVIENPC